MLPEERKFNYLVFSWFSNWRFKSFSLGLNLCSEPGCIIIDDRSYDALNSDGPVPMINYREFYVCINMAFWQLSIGFRVKKKSN
jgi:hypothetical protein